MRTRLALAVPLVLFAVSACSGSGDTDDQTLEPTATPTAGSSAAASSAPTATSAATQPAASGQATTGTGTQAPTASPVAVRPLSTRAPGTTSAAKATAPGDYTYASSGTVTVGATPQDVDGTQTLTISPLKNGIQHSRLHSEETGDTEQDVVVRDTGSYGASLKLTSPAFTREFRPDPAVLLVPDPAVVGRAWSWSATSTDGKTTATATNKLLRKETLTIGGTKVDTVVLSTHLELKDPEFSYTADLTVWWAPSYRLPVKQRSVGKGSFGALPFTTDITGTLTSVNPR